MQRYLLASLSLILLTVIVAAYSWQAPTVSTPHLAVLSRNKPIVQTAVTVAGSEIAANVSPASVEIELSPVSIESGIQTGLTDPLLKPALPQQYDQLEATIELKEETEIGEIQFSTDISDEYQAVDPGRRFGDGFYTLYATFDYGEMADGMTWSWVWKHNGLVIDGGNQVWQYGDEGPGYVYFKPEEGFQLGEYSLEVWVNTELMAQSDFMVIDSISASN